MTYEEVEEYINSIPKFVKKNKPEHTKAFLSKIGNPQNGMKIIHVAGTNGKGSVCAFVSNILNESGKKTGLFVSPHLVEMTERISICNKNVTKEEFVEGFINVKAVADEMKNSGYDSPSYFEFLFLMAMDIFGRNNVEYAVLETGLGGRLDATNIIESPEVSVITSIGYDHMEILGDTIEKISAEKAGIIKKNIPVVYQANDDTVRHVIEKKAADMDAVTHPVAYKDYKIIKKSDNYIDFCPVCGYYVNIVFRIPFIAEYQVENAMLAITAVSLLKDIRRDSDAVKNGLSGVRWQGRMEQVMPGVYFDGAHNGPGIDCFVKTVSDFECSGRKLILFSAVKEKDYDYMANEICNYIKPDKVYITSIDGTRSVSADTLAAKFFDTDIYISDDIETVYKTAIKEKETDDVLFCVGSLYLIGELKKLLKC